MKRRVLHFVRRNTQLKSSFIYNQISHHLDFDPLIVFRKNNYKSENDGFADFNLGENNYLDLSEREKIIEKIRFTTCKTLSSRQMLLIEQFVKKNEIEICHFHYGTDCGVFYPFQNKLKAPSVVSFYGYDAFSFPKRFWGFGKEYLIKRVFTKVDCILAMSSEMKEDLVSIGCPSQKIKIHYHGVPARIFNLSPGSYEQGRSEFNLLNISYLDPVKGHIFIFKALKYLISQGFGNIKLRIWGYGFFEPELKNFVDQNHLEEHVSFLGPLKYGSIEMLSEFRQADAFIHPSVLTKDDKEGIPGAIVEAMMAGLPVISTFHGGIPHIIENEKTGLLVKEWDIPGLASAIKKLVLDKDFLQKIGKAGREYAIENLDIEKKERELEEIYNELISNKNGFDY